MIVATVIVAALAGALFGGLWFGERQYRFGVRHGRRLEALDAKHARDRIVQEVEISATLTALKRADDERMIAGWVRRAQPRRRTP